MNNFGPGLDYFLFFTDKVWVDILYVVTPESTLCSVLRCGRWSPPSIHGLEGVPSGAFRLSITFIKAQIQHGDAPDITVQKSQ